MQASSVHCNGVSASQVLSLRFFVGCALFAPLTVFLVLNPARLQLLVFRGAVVSAFAG